MNFSFSSCWIFSFRSDIVMSCTNIEWRKRQHVEAFFSKTKLLSWILEAVSLPSPLHDHIQQCCMCIMKIRDLSWIRKMFEVFIPGKIKIWCLIIKQNIKANVKQSADPGYIMKKENLISLTDLLEDFCQEWICRICFTMVCFRFLNGSPWLVFRGWRTFITCNSWCFYIWTE